MIAREITIALGGRWNATTNRGSARCPCHDDRSPSLSLSDGDEPGRILVHCFAGCDRRDILAALRDRGLLDEYAHRQEPRSRRIEPPPPVITPDPQALAIWGMASPVEHTIVQLYLRARGIAIAPPPSLRCAGGGYHLTDPATAMVAAVQAPDRRTIAVQVTRLDPSGERKAQVPIPRRTYGALRDGAVRLAAAGDVLGLAEGVESALSAMQLSGIPTWACLGASRMHRVAVPDSVRELHLFLDNDGPGRDAGERTADAHPHHRHVVLRRPPDHLNDWNDFLRAKGERHD
jgi:putative DNA primase/helicase